MTAASELHIVPDRAGLWRQLISAPNAAVGKRPALFLDRDGVVVEEVNYLHRVDEVEICPGAADTISLCNEAGIPVILVTNQSGVGRGYYGWPEFAAVQNELIRRLAVSGAQFDMVLACAYHTEGRAPYDQSDHDWRKPRPGMILEAARALNIDLARSWIMGDSASDIEAGKIAGLAGGVHLLSGHGQRDREKSLALTDTRFEVIVEPGIGSARHIQSRLLKQPR